MAKNADEGRLAKRYARALFELYKQESLDAADAALHEIAETWEQQEVFRTAMLNPSSSVTDREAVLKEVASLALANDETLASFLVVLLQNHRLSYLPAISRQFSFLLRSLKEQLSFVVTSAFPLSDEEKQSFKQSAEQQFGSLVQVEWHTDESLIGGLLVKAGDTVLDNTISGSLEKMRGSLLS